MDAVDLAFMPALEQAKLIRQGVLSPLELTQLYLDRIQTLNPILGSYFYVMQEQALAEAKAKTEQLGACRNDLPNDLPPFFGVPISIKDLNPVAGVPCSYGVKAACDRIATTDDGIVTLIKQAGFTILGKTATAQLGSFPYTEPPGFPPARNPWNPDFTSGGSSGGAASALAAGLCALAQGSDGGGSIRGPAFCCGLVGIKPSRGRVTMAPAGERLAGLATNAPLGRTVADAAALLDAMSGYVTGDPYWLPSPEGGFLSAARQTPPPLRVAMVTAIPPLGDTDPICRQAIIDTARLLEQLGHQVEPHEFPDLGDLIEPFTLVWQSVLAEAGIPFFVLERVNRWLYWRARRVGSGQYLRALTRLQLLARKIVAACEPYDVLLLPTYLHPTIRIGEWRGLRPARILDNIIQWIAPCPPFNTSGQPAIALPTGFDPRGLPIGVQLVGRPAGEFTLISLAAQIEREGGWGQSRPAIATERFTPSPP